MTKEKMQELAHNLDTLSVDELTPKQMAAVQMLVRHGYLSIKKFTLPDGEVIYEEVQCK